MSGCRHMMDRLFKSILSIREFKIRVDDDYTDRCVRLRVKWCKTQRSARGSVFSGADRTTLAQAKDFPFAESDILSCVAGETLSFSMERRHSMPRSVSKFGSETLSNSIKRL